MLTCFPLSTLQFSVSSYWTIHICEVHILSVKRIRGPIYYFFLRKNILKRQNSSTNVTTSKKTLTYAGWHKLEVYFKELQLSPNNAYPPFSKAGHNELNNGVFYISLNLHLLNFIFVSWVSSEASSLTQVVTVLSAWGIAALGLLRQEGLKNK